MAVKRLPSEERKKTILEATLKILQNKGYSSLTIRNISLEIGISEAAIYKHFEDKEDILNQLAAWIFDENDITIDQIQEKDELKTLEHILKRKFSTLEDNPAFTAVLFQDELFREYESVKNQFDEHRKKNEKSLMKIVQKGIEEGTISKDIDPEIFSELYMGAIRMTVLKWRYGDFSFKLTDRADAIIEDLFKILKKEGDR